MTDERSDESPADVGGDSGSGANRSSTQIPGYQAVERVPGSVSFGIWIRGVQTRLHRKVLLKLLPTGNEKLDEFMEREIAATVRLEATVGVDAGDRYGPLRVIEDGRAEGIRFVVYDEAGSSPLEAGTSLTEEEAFGLARLLERAHRVVEKQDAVLLPVSVGSLRRLPAGDLAIADLGWIVPLGEALPKHPAIGDEGLQPARAGHSVRFLGQALRGIHSELAGSAPKAIARVADELAEWDLDDGFPDDSLIPTPTVAAPASRVPLIAGGAVLVIALVAAILFGSGLLSGGSDPDGPPTVAGGSPNENDVDVDVTGSGGPTETDPSTSTTAAGTEQSQAAELRQLADAFAISEDRDAFPALLRTLRDATSPSDAAVLELQGLADDAGDSQVGIVVALMLRVDAARSLGERFEEWPPVEALVRSLNESGRHQDALDTLEAFPTIPELPPLEANIVRAVESTGDDPLSKLVETAKSRVDKAESAVGETGGIDAITTARGELRAEIEAASRSRLEARIAAANAAAEARDYELAKSEIAMPEGEQLLDADETTRIERRSRIQTEMEQYLAATTRWDTTRREIEQRLAATTSKSEWATALSRLDAIGPIVEPFPRISSQVDRWRGWIERGRDSEAALAEALESIIGVATKIVVSTGDEPIRVKVTSVADGTFRAKIVGRTEEREWRFVDLTPRSMAEILIAGRKPGRAEEDWALSLFLRGEPLRGLSAAGSTDAVEWGPAAEDAIARDRVRRLQETIEKATALIEDGNESEARDLVIELVESDPLILDLEGAQDQLIPLVEAYYLKEGPKLAFRAGKETWLKDTRQIELEYDFTSDEEALDWKAVGEDSIVTHKRGRLESRGRYVLLGTGKSDRVFENQLSVVAEMTPGNRRQPNLNVVLFARTDTEVSGLLVGLGCRPPDVAHIDGVGPTPVNVLGQAGSVLGGAGQFLEVDSTVKAGRRNRIEAGYDALSETASAKIDGSGDWSASRLVAKPSAGTVAVDSFRSEASLLKIVIRGEVSRSWWKAWRLNRCREDLGLER